jgi:lysophospholipase L1-like esterase
VVLFWGNSLLFDHSWDDSSFVPVNCARQGQTVRDALPRIPALPRIDPDAIVLAFGSVELIRPQPINVQDWRADMQALVETLRVRYPDAQLLVTGIPATPQGPTPWHYGSRAELTPMNAALSALLDTEFLDLSAALIAAGLTRPHYDGVHLTRASYRVWETMIAARFDR